MTLTNKAVVKIELYLSKIRKTIEELLKAEELLIKKLEFYKAVQAEKEGVKKFNERRRMRS